MIENMTFSFRELPKLVNGNPNYKGKIRNDTVKYTKQIIKLRDNITTISNRYEKCCKEIQGVYHKYLSKSVFHENKTVFDDKVKTYKKTIIETFNPAGGQLNDIFNKLDTHAGKLFTLQDDLRENRGGPVNDILNELAKTMADLENTHEKVIVELLNTGKCLKKDEVSNDFAELLGKVSCFNM